MESLVQEKLGLYYALFVVFVGLSIFFNVREEKRQFQTKIARYYFILTCLFGIVTFLEFILKLATKDLDPANYSDVTVKAFISIMCLLSKGCTYIVSKYPTIIGAVLAFGLVKKFGLKINDWRDKLDLSKLKDNMILKKFFNKERQINDAGKVTRKAFQNLSLTLVIIYLIMPIFWHFNLMLLFSSFTNLFLIAVFLEFYFSLNCGFIVNNEIEKAEEKNKQPLKIMNTALKDLLKLLVIEKLDESNKMVVSENNITGDKTSLLCEVANWEQFKDINMNVMNGAFFENKKVLVICKSQFEAEEYNKNLVRLNSEYDGKLSIKLLTNKDKIFDSNIDIYISTLELLFGNMKFLNKLDTILIEDIDNIMQQKLELLRAFGSIVKMANPLVRYVFITYMKQGIEAAIKNLLFIDEIAIYNMELKQQPSALSISVWDKKNVEIGDIILGKINHNLGNMIPLALLSVEKETDRILVVSESEPLEFQLNELNAIKNLAEKKFMNDEIEGLNKAIRLSKRLKYFAYKGSNYIVLNDLNCNLYDTIYKVALINGKKNYINILSPQYLLRDYMIANYEKNRSRLKYFLPYIPYEVENSKVILYNLILQLTNFGVSEDILIRVFNQNEIPISIDTDSVVPFAKALNYYISKEFKISIDTYSYVILKKDNSNFVFDTLEKSFNETKKVYMLDREILKILPNELFSEIIFTKDGFVLDIEEQYTYNFYQKYLPGQKHFLNNSVYEIKEIINSNNEINAHVEAVTDYTNNMYRQVRDIKMLNDMKVDETVSHKYEDIMVTYMLGNVGFEVTTLGYYEFNNGLMLKPNEYRYVKLSDKNIENIRRNYGNSRVLKIEYSKILNDTSDVETLFGADYKDIIAQCLVFVLTETLYSMLGDNANYVQVKAVVSNSYDVEDSNWVRPIVVDDKRENIEIYIFEDVELERGLVDLIYKNIDNIFNIMYDYLEWLFDENTATIRNIYKDEYLLSFNKDTQYIYNYKYVKKLLSETKFGN